MRRMVGISSWARRKDLRWLRCQTTLERFHWLHTYLSEVQCRWSWVNVTSIATIVTGQLMMLCSTPKTYASCLHGTEPGTGYVSAFAVLQCYTCWLPIHHHARSAKRTWTSGRLSVALEKAKKRTSDSQSFQPHMSFRFVLGLNGILRADASVTNRTRFRANKRTKVSRESHPLIRDRSHMVLTCRGKETPY